MFHRTEKEIILNNAGVDSISAFLSSQLKKNGIKRTDVTRTCLTMEELLIRIKEHYDNEIKVNLQTKKIFGTPIINLTYEGESFNPTDNDSLEDDEVLNSIIPNLGLSPVWSYKSGTNRISLRGPSESWKSEIILIIAFIAAVIIGLFPSVFPENVRTGLTNFILNPLSDLFLNAMNTFVGIMIFTSVASGISSIGSMTDFSKMGRHVIFRMINRTFLGTIFGALITFPFFHIKFGSASSGKSQSQEIVNLIISTIPENPVTPFVDGNFLQIIFMSIMVGTGLLILDEKTNKIRSLVAQANHLFTHILSVVCKLLPIYIFSSLVVLFWENGQKTILNLWSPIVISIGIMCLMLFMKLVFTSMKLKVPMGILMSKIKKPAIIGLLTSSSSAAFNEMVDTNEKKLGINPDFDKFALPFGNILVGSTTGASLVVIIYYLAEQNNTPANAGWFLTICLMCGIFGISMPPVSGSMLACISMIMTQIGMPATGLPIAGLLGIILDFFMTSTKIGITHLELVLDADHLGVLDRSILEKPIK